MRERAFYDERVRHTEPGEVNNEVVRTAIRWGIVNTQKSLEGGTTEILYGNVPATIQARAGEKWRGHRHKHRHRPTESTG